MLRKIQKQLKTLDSTKYKNDIRNILVVSFMRSNYISQVKFKPLEL